MRRNKLSLFVHLVWATWDRLPLLTPEIELRVWRNVVQEAVGLGCKVVAVNGMPDHVHLLLMLPSTVSVAEVVKQVKGVSSHFVNDELRPQGQFKWQGSYGAFSVGYSDVDRIAAYVKRQKQHHAASELLADYEETYEEVEATSAKVGD